jgi:hypothetical protein
MSVLVELAIAIAVADVFSFLIVSIFTRNASHSH